jgi:hypothetical protein
MNKGDIVKLLEDAIFTGYQTITLYRGEYLEVIEALPSSHWITLRSLDDVFWETFSVPKRKVEFVMPAYVVKKIRDGEI